MQQNTNNIIQTLEAQLNHRLEKLWRVFSWCSSILLSLTAGVIAISGSKDFKLNITGRVLLSAIILVITIYAWTWINENLKFERNIRNLLDKIYEEEFNFSKLKDLRPDNANFGYKDVIILLGIVSLAATWLIPFLQ